jgi:hypothetical protein
MNGAIRIEVVGLPTDDERVLWLQDDGFGGKAGVMADEDFVEVVMDRMENIRRIELLKRRAMEAAMNGMRGMK